MIGIDVIDLSCSFSKKKHSLSKYKNRILQPAEYEFCHEWIDLECIWAIKESAYKCHYQIFAKEFYNPKRILISHFDPQRGLFEANIDEKFYQGRFLNTETYVYAIARPASSIINPSSFYLAMNPERMNQEEELVHYFKEEAPEAVYQFHATGFPYRVSIGPKLFDYSRSHHGSYYISVITPAQHN